MITFDERVSLIFEDIQKEYPLLTKEEAYECAVLSSSVDNKTNNDNRFSMQYFILRKIGRNHQEFSHVFNDIFKTYQDGVNDHYSDVMFEIIRYAIQQRNNFPQLEEE